MLFQYLRKFEVAICRNRTTSVCLEENSIGNILQHSSHQISKQKWLELLEARWRVETKLLTACCHNHNWEACQWPNSKKARNIIYSFWLPHELAGYQLEQGKVLTMDATIMYQISQTIYNIVYNNCIRPPVTKVNNFMIIKKYYGMNLN